MRGGVLHAGVDHTGIVPRVVGEKLAETRESKILLQLFSFINQTLHLSTKYSLLYKYNFENFETKPDNPAEDKLQSS